MSSLVKGTMILTLGMFLSKVLGLIYIFPFYAIVGEENVALYQYAYIPYSIMLSIAVSGVPVAVSKFVAKYNSMGDYESGRKLLKSSILLMMITGFLAFLLLFILANPIAEIIITSKQQAFTVDQVAGVIRWVSCAVIIVPFMSVWRGFFQGYGIMEPTAISQLIEQIIRVIFLLSASFIVVIILKGKPETAISLSVFAAFVGAIGGIATLFYFWKKHKPEFNRLRQENTMESTIDLKDTYKEVLQYSVPFVFVGLANTLFQAIDLLTFNRAMVSIGLASVSDLYLSMINFTTHKVVIIPVMLATSLSLALIPYMTKLYTQKELDTLRSTMDKTYQILFFITLPAVVGISLLSYEIYYMLYSESEMGATVLAHYAPVAILFALFSVTAALLQGINYQKWIIFSLLTGLLIKLMLNIPFIKMMQTDGAILATAIGYIVAISINLIVLKKILNYRSIVVKRRIILIVILTAIMAICVYLTQQGIIAIFGPVDSKLYAIFVSFICVGVGVVVYGFLSLKLGLAQKLLGSKITKFANKLGFK